MVLVPVLQVIFLQLGAARMFSDSSSRFPSCVAMVGLGGFPPVPPDEATTWLLFARFFESGFCFPSRTFLYPCRRREGTHTHTHNTVQDADGAVCAALEETDGM